MKVSGRTIVYVALSAAVSLPFFVDAYLRTSGNATLWLTLVGVNIALWSSWPRYRSALLQQATLTLTLLVVANLVLSPFVAVARPEAVPALMPNIAMKLQITGDTLPGLSSVQSITTDARGYRTNRPIDYEAKPPNVVRIVALGGSTTEEIYLDDRRTWTFLLAERLAKALGKEVEIINTGVSGLRAEQNLLTLVASEGFAPDVAIFMLGINDWNSAITATYSPPPDPVLSKLKTLSFFDSVLHRGLIELRNMASTAVLPPSNAADGTRIEDGSYFSKQNDSLSRPRKVEFLPNSVSDAYAASVRQIMQECRRRGIPCVFIDQATAYDPGVDPELKRRFWMTPPNQPYTASLGDLQHTARVYNDWLAATVRANGLPFCSLAHKIPPTTEFFYDDCHFNEKGARLVAQLIADCLLKDGIAPLRH